MIILIGPPGSLAPEVAAELSQRTGAEFADTQALIDQLMMDEDPNGYAEERLRSIEHDVAVAALNSVDARDERILALGSGCLGNSRDDTGFADVRAKIEELRDAGALVIHLTGSLKVLSHRNGLDGPRLAAVSSPRRIFFTQLSSRTPLYEQMASATIDTTELEPGDVAGQVLGRVS